MTEVRVGSLNASDQKVAIVDTDVHEAMRSVHELESYLKEPWRSIVLKGSVGKVIFPYSLPIGSPVLGGSIPQGGGPAGSDLALLKRQLLDEYDLSGAILNGQFSLPTELQVQSELGNAMAAAYNSWLIANWLSKDHRLYGSICINANDPVGAAREIDRVGDHPKMVQVCLLPLQHGYGESFYDPIFDAAQRHQLVVGIHTSGNATAPIGYPPYFIEWRTCFPQQLQSQLVSLVAHGVFEKFPRLRVSLIEGGWTWLPSLLWRFDLSYRSLRFEVPWLHRMPSEYVRSHVRLTTQPTDAVNLTEFLHLLDVLGSDELLMFSSGYPHWDFDSPRESLPDLPRAIAENVYANNARFWYGL